MLITARIPLLLPLLAASPAFAQCVGMPEGARGYLEASNSNIPCGEAVSGVGSLPIPSANYCSANSCSSGQVLLANGDHNAQRLRMATFRYRGTPLHVHNGMADLYTISGPPGTEGTPVEVRIVCRMTGTLFTPFHGIIGGQPMYYYPVNSIQLEIGTWAQAYNSDFHEQFRVNAFGPAFTTTATFNAPQSSTMLFQPVDVTIDQPLTRTVGTPFEVGYYMVNATGSAGNYTGSTNPPDEHYFVTTIDWDLPPGYSMTSERGWIDPDAPTCDAIDFNGDGLFPDTLDVDDFVSVFAGGACSTGTCGDIDFNNDGLFPDTADMDAFIAVFGGGACV